MQFRDGTVFVDNPMPLDGEMDDSRMWYVRLRIRDDRLAKLWVWKLADHDVIVWSESEERWKRLLAVPELRAAVRSATTSAYARTKPPSEAPAALSEALRASSAPPPISSAPPPASTKRRPLASLEELDFDEPSTQLHQALHQDIVRDDEEAPTRVRQRLAAERLYSDAPTKPVDPLLHALTTSIPPAVHSTPAPEIPRAPRLPSFVDLFPHQQPIKLERGPVPRHVQSMPQAVSQLSAPASRHVQSIPRALSHLSTAGPQFVRSLPRNLSQFSIKNISWAMLPVACAGIFAVYLDRNPSVIERTRIVTQQVPASVGGAAIDAEASTNERLASLLVGAAPMCVGQPQEQPRVLSPDQLVAIPNSPSTRGRAWKAVAGTVPRKIYDKSQSASLSAGTSSASSASAELNEFDREGAKTALRFAIARVRNCSNSGLSGSALITFAPNGIVQSVQLNQLVGDDVDPSCVTRALSASRVPPFTGNAVTVRKSF